MPNLPLKAWLSIGAVTAVLFLFGAYKYQQHRADRAEARLRPAVATGKALDAVATETNAINQDAEEKAREVDRIEGADAKLPDGFGRDLQRIRVRERK